MNSETPLAKEDSGDPVENSNVLDMQPSEFENDPVSPSILEVLENDMLLDMIVSFSVMSESVTDQNSSEVQLTGVRSLRLVNRAWLQSVSRVMTKKGRPLFNFDFQNKILPWKSWQSNMNNHLGTCPYTGIHWLLDTDDNTIPLPIHQPVPPFKMEIDFDKFTGEKEVNRLLRKCFLKYGAGLVVLRISTSKAEGDEEDKLEATRQEEEEEPNTTGQEEDKPDAMGQEEETIGSEISVPVDHDLPEIFSLPNLKTLKIHSDIENRKATSVAESLFVFVHSILETADSLINCEIRANFKIRVSANCSISFNLPFIPASLQRLTVHQIGLGGAKLEALLGNQLLPNLTQLKLIDKDNEQLEDGTLFKILDNLKDSLKIFEMVKCKYRLLEYEYASGVNRSLLRFPVMEKLEKLKICEEYVELEPGQAPMQTFIPNVNHLELTHQTEELLQRWMEGSEYPAVETLVMETVFEDNFDSDDWKEICQGINLEVAGWIHTSFPNVTKLTVLVLPEETSGLKTIFEMTQLTSLHIQVRGTNDYETDPYFMDSALTGLPRDIVSTFTDDPELCAGIEINRGIGKLKNLQSLYLEHMRDDYYARSGSRLSLDLTFSCALRHLQKLETVRLTRGQSSTWLVSPEVRRELNGKIKILEA